MTIQLVEEARDDFLDAILHYEEVRADLGRRFKEEVDRSILWVADHPELYRLRPSGYRRVNLRIFPYYIPFAIRGERLWVLAIAHSACKPRYWISRRLEADGPSVGE